VTLPVSKSIRVRRLSLAGPLLICTAGCTSSGGKDELVVPPDTCELHLDAQHVAPFLSAGEVQGNLSVRNNDYSWNCMLTVPERSDQGAIDLFSYLTTDKPNLLEATSVWDGPSAPDRVNTGDGGYVDENHFRAYSECRDQDSDLIYFSVEVIVLLGLSHSNESSNERRMDIQRLGTQLYDERIRQTGCS
jgi:hypothetical protein